MKDPSQLSRWTLLITSLITLVLLVGAALRENYLSQWQFVQRAYREILEEKATDERGREIQANYRIELRQASVPALDTVDRCVTCHVGIDDPRMTDVRQPFTVHPGDLLKHHPVDRFGCTICHHGQGAATNFEDAKAEDAYWEYPLLTAELTQSSCLACHDARQLPPEQVGLLLEGMELYEGKSCGSCHELKGRGGTLGPALDNEGAKSRHQLIMANLEPPHTAWRWHQAHFRDPGAVVADSQMTNPTVTNREALALTVYMLALWERDVPESYLAPDKIEQKFHAMNPAPLPAAEVYQEYCTACHGDGAYGRWDKTLARFIPAIRGPLAATATPEYLEANIAQGRPGTLMPAWAAQAGGLLPQEISGLVDYLRAGAAPTVVSSAGIVPGDAGHGGVLFAQNCAGCHGPAGRAGTAPELANPVFLSSASDAFIVTTVRNGRAGTAMPAFQRRGAAALSDTEIGDLLAYIRSWGQGAEATQQAKAEPETGSAGGAP
jgi:cbb3-type cytochrome c oxidase subunit III